MKYYIILILIGANCNDTPIEPKSDEKALKILWSVETNLIDIPNVPPLVIENSSIIYAGEKDLVSIDITTSKVLWSAFIDGERPIESKILLFDKVNKRIISNHFNFVKGWDSENGNSIYTLSERDGIIAHIRGRNTVVNNGFAIVGDTLDGYVVNTDKSIRFKLDNPLGTASISYKNQKIYLGKTNNINGGLTIGKLLVLNSNNADSIWSYETNNSGFGTAQPQIEEDIIYAGTFGNSPEHEFVALNAEDGEVIWRYISEDIYTYSFVLGSKYIYVNNSGALIALNKADGERIWMFNVSSSAALIQPVYLSGYVYHSDHNRLFVLDAETGGLVHEESVPEGGEYFWHLAVSEDKLFVQTSTQLIAYEPWHLRD